jgi:hypothetical protein
LWYLFVEFADRAVGVAVAVVVLFGLGGLDRGESVDKSELFRFGGFGEPFFE